MRALSILVLASGCFYMEPVNQRPSIGIVPSSSDPLHRGDNVTLDARIDDPEGQAVALTWRAYACSDATVPGGCDDTTFKDSLPTDAAQDFNFTVPIHRADGTDVQSLRIELDAVDSLGATAKPSQELVMPVIDGPPTLMLRSQSRYGYVINTPVQIYALVGDPDDGAPAVKPLGWQVFSPTSPAPPLTDITTPPATDPTMLQFGKQLVPDQLGNDWKVQVTATDPLGVQTVQIQPLTIVADHAPCLAQSAPIAPPPGSTLPITDPTLFEVLVVDDDLDPYPTILNDAIYGAETFTWSLLPPGATTRQVLTGATGASVPIDPASYTPGDIVELRVEIGDRNHTPVNCTDSDPTCSVISDPSCIQRLTWRVEVR